MQHNTHCHVSRQHADKPYLTKALAVVKVAEGKGLAGENVGFYRSRMVRSGHKWH
jgi:hypothetical protein